MTNTAAFWKEKGNECMKSGDFSEAVNHYKKGLAIEPNNPILNCNIAQAYLQLKQYTEAEKSAKTAFAFKKDYTKAYYRAANAALGRLDLYEAMLYLVSGVKNCYTEDLRDLFSKARELSPEFEKSLKINSAKLKEQKESDKKESKEQGKCDSATSGLCCALEKYSNFVKHEDKTEKRPTFDLYLEVELTPLKPVKHKAEKEHKDQEGKRHLATIDASCALEKHPSTVKYEDKSKERPTSDVHLKGEEVVDKKPVKLKAGKEPKDQDVKQKLKEPKKKEKDKPLNESINQNRRDEESVALATTLQNYMKEGSLALWKGLNRKAVEFLKKANDIIISHPPPEKLGLDHMECVVLQYTLSKALILSEEYNDIIKAVTLLENMEKEGKHSKFPALLHLQGNAFIRLNRFEHAKQPIERGLAFLKRGLTLSRYSWPGTMDVIDMTDRVLLQKALEDNLALCKSYQKPNCICRYEKCLTTNSHHIIPSQNIYFSDPDFVGYVSVVCQQQCHIEFHLSCWKDYKEGLSVVHKPSEKEMLLRDCFTPDCYTTYRKRSVIVKISIIGPDGEEKSSCECKPPTPPVLDSVILEEPLKKKQTPKKKDVEKPVKHPDKLKPKSLTKHLSMPTAISQAPLLSDEDLMPEYMKKLIVLRENRFGYEEEDNYMDPRTVRKCVGSFKHTTQEKEFIYSFFLEIFKEESFMSMEKLKEHWEAHQDMLPPIQPELIVFTDFVRFLLESDQFVLVHNVIGLISHLPSIYTIVQSEVKTECSKVLNTTRQSPPTSLFDPKQHGIPSFTSFSSEHSPGFDYPSYSNGHIFNNGETCSKYISNSLSTTLSDSLHFKDHNSEQLGNIVSNEGIPSKCNEFFMENTQGYSSEELHYTYQNYGKFEDQSNFSKKNVYGKYIPKNESVFNSFHSNGISPTPTEPSCRSPTFSSVTPSKLAANLPSQNETVDDKSSFQSTTNGKNHLPESPCGGSSMESYSPPMENSNASHLNVNSVKSDKSHLSKKDKAGGYKQLLISNGFTIADSEKLCNGTTLHSRDQSPATANTSFLIKKGSWRPGAKLWTWAQREFPNESPKRLVQALCTVRTQNNNTLSLLPLDVIGARVKNILPQLDFVEV